MELTAHSLNTGLVKGSHIEIVVNETTNGTYYRPELGDTIEIIMPHQIPIKALVVSAWDNDLKVCIEGDTTEWLYLKSELLLTSNGQIYFYQIKEEELIELVADFA